MSLSKAALDSARTVVRRNLIGFTAATFPGYRPAGFHWSIGRLLDSIVHGDKPRRVMIFMPPRHGKSELVSVRLPAYYLGNRPDDRIIHVSYGASLSNLFSRQARNLLVTPEYQGIFPGILPAKDSRSVKQWHIGGHKGAFFSCGVGGAVTGKGANLMIIDDPIKSAREANSEIVRASQQAWYRQDLRTRLQPGGSIVLCQTRWHMADLAGWLLEESKGKEEFAWEVMVHPAYDEVNKAWLWPEQYSDQEYEDLKRDAGKYGWAALFQQNPVPYGGGMLQRKWFTVLSISDAPKMVRSVMGVDLAYTEKTSADFTAALPVSIDKEGRIYFWPPFYGQVEWPDGRAGIIARARTRRCAVVGVESTAFQKALAQDLRKTMAAMGIAVVDAETDADKVTRVLDWSPIASTGLITLIEDGTGWTDVFLKEAEEFPLGKHDDLVDAAGHGLATLRKNGDREIKRRGS